MPLTDKQADIANYLFNLMGAAHGVDKVFYGDQEKLPTTPAICIEPDNKTRSLKGAQRQTRVEFRVYVIVYHGDIRSPQANRKDADILAETIEDQIHADPRMGDRVIHSMVTEVNSGYSNKDKTLVRATRLLVEAESQKILPTPS